MEEKNLLFMDFTSKDKVSVSSVYLKRGNRSSILNMDGKDDLLRHYSQQQRSSALTLWSCSIVHLRMKTSSASTSVYQ
jgi:hypothetical protein